MDLWTAAWPATSAGFVLGHKVCMAEGCSPVCDADDHAWHTVGQRPADVVVRVKATRHKAAS